MRKLLLGLLTPLLLIPIACAEEMYPQWRLLTADGSCLTTICEEPTVGDQYISAGNDLYEIVEVQAQHAIVQHVAVVDLPPVTWLDADAVIPVSAAGSKRIALYCTHSDESYTLSDGVYSTNNRGSIYQVAQALADALTEEGIDAKVSDALHHPHDAGAYRRSRQTAVQLLKEDFPDCLIDIHRDGIPDPASYAVNIGGMDVSKVRLLVGRGNQNAEANKEFALLIKAVADRVYPGLIKDIYLGKGTFNQDLLPRSLLFECGTYTLEKERVLKSMELMADVLNRALYGGVVGSTGRISSDTGAQTNTPGRVIMGEPDPATPSEKASGKGWLFLLVLIVACILGLSILSAGSLRRGAGKAGRSLHEMTGGLVGKKQRPDEDPEHS